MSREAAMRLLQVLKRPEIVGGAAACAWSVCRALPDWSHTLFFCWRGEIPARTRQAFAGHRLLAAPTLGAGALAAVEPDAILLHNTADAELAPAVLAAAAAPAFLYLHGSYQRLPSFAGLMAASRRVFCVSAYLARELGLPAAAVWYQPVADPPGEGGPAEPPPLTVGRLCNPRRENWGEETVAFYRQLARRCPGVQWEFVGCPPALRLALTAALEAAGGEAVFQAASFAARAHLRRWHAVLYRSPVVHAYGRVVCEAQRVGCVPVVDRLGGFLEQVENGRTGFLCEGGEDFAAALGALRDTARWRAMAEQARASAAGRGALAVWREELLEHLREAA